MIQNKKIILVCKEVNFYPMYFFGQELKKHNNDVHYFFIHNTEVIDQNLLSIKTLYFLKKKI